ncbi:MAG: DUF4325 domain-containing protein [Candidatus Uhrbacteria bacterium]|nr:DUF4325 domain-containing protein [Patescibacteria group bacterium]MBU1906626.1 DUF4325 domain-containing protein [Patescibacteria group bacterium]
MIINITKFGSVLTSRQAGKEAYLAFTPTLEGVGEEEEIVIDFEGVAAFSPSWGDEFLTPLNKSFGGRLFLKNTENPSVSLTISTLEETTGLKYQIM